MLDILRAAQQAMYGEYEEMLDSDVARELARINLPLSLYTEWYWQIDLHNLFHFLRLRLDPHAQYEIRVYGDAMAEIASGGAGRVGGVRGLHIKKREVFAPGDEGHHRKPLRQTFTKESLESKGLKGREAEEFLEKLGRIQEEGE